MAVYNLRRSSGSAGSSPNGAFATITVSNSSPLANASEITTVPRSGSGRFPALMAGDISY